MDAWGLGAFTNEKTGATEAVTEDLVLTFGENSDKIHVERCDGATPGSVTIRQGTARTKVYIEVGSNPGDEVPKLTFTADDEKVAPLTLQQATTSQSSQAVSFGNFGDLITDFRW